MNYSLEARYGPTELLQKRVSGTEGKRGLKGQLDWLTQNWSSWNGQADSQIS